MPIIVLLPTIGWAWPALMPILTSAAGVLGYHAFTDQNPNALLRGKLNAKMNQLKKVNLQVDSKIKDLISEDLGVEESINFKKGDITIIFRKNVRGKFEIEVYGPNSAKDKDLKKLAEEFVGTVIQQFAQNKIAKELEQRGLNIVEEEVDQEGNIILQIRKWE